MGKDSDSRHGLWVVAGVAACGGGGDGGSTTTTTTAANVVATTPASNSGRDQLTVASTLASTVSSSATSRAVTTTDLAVEAAGQTACGDPLAGRAVVMLLNQLRAQGALCGDAAQAPAAALRWDDRLAAAAARHAADSAAVGAVTHVRSDGSSVAQRVADAGYSAWGVGENVAAGVTSAARVLALWQDSPPHCVNMLAPQYTDVGVACASDARSPWGEHWIMVLARGAGTP